MVRVKTDLVSKDPRSLRMKGLLMEGDDKEEVEEDENDNEKEKDEGEEDESESESDSGVVIFHLIIMRSQRRVMRKK